MNASHEAPPGWRAAGELDAGTAAAVFAWLVRLRWVALLGVAVVLVLAGPVADSLPAESTALSWGVAGALLVFNSALALLGPERSGWMGRLVVQIVVDVVALAALVQLAGGPENPFLLLFVLHAITTNIALTRRAAALVLGLSAALVALIVFGEGAGFLAHHCLHREGRACSAGRLDLWSLAVVGGVTLTLVASAVLTRHLADLLGESRAGLVQSVRQLESERDRLARAREAGESERAKLQAILDCMRDAVVFAGTDGEVRLSNRGGRELIRAEGGGRVEAGEEGPAASWSLAEQLRRALSSGGAAHTAAAFELEGRVLEPTYSTVRTPDGNLGVVMVARDISERLALRSHLRHEERLSVVGKLAATVAHEINNPIGVVSLYSQHALAKLPADSPVRMHLETIRRNADSCRKIIGSLLELARPRKAERRELDLRLLCREVLDSLMPLAERSGVRLSSGDHDRAAPILYCGDGDQLRQAVLNLALNAIEAARPGDAVSVGAWEAQEGDSAVRVVEVHDTGPGIPAAQLPHLFEPFHTTKESGTGLGLAVAENIIDSHAGRITVESAEGKGSTFRIILPSSPAGEARGGARPEAASSDSIQGTGAA